VRSCHDLSDGGLAVALAEMATAGGLGAEVELPESLAAPEGHAGALFGEAPGRFVVEVEPDAAEAVADAFGPSAAVRLGRVVEAPRLEVRAAAATLIDAPLAALKRAWQHPKL
jgi:phosphoribosylformylglycinamidine synthase